MSSDVKPTSDVRMRGFAARQTVEEALEWVDRFSIALPAETIAATAAFGRVLAEDVRSPLNVPAFDRSAMDGYAVRAVETDGVSDYSPVILQILGESMPGRPATVSAKPGTAVRIMTGAPIPDGYNAVVPAEYAREQSGHVEITSPVTPGKNVGRIGEDIRAEGELLNHGRRLRPQDLGVLASIGRTEVAVVRSPRVRILIAGNELVFPGEPRGPWQIYEANSPMLQALVIRDGAVVDRLERLKDDRQRLKESLTQPGADVVLITGGSSVGAEDFAPGLVRELGTLDLHGIAMRPSSPAGMGKIEESLVFLLPGNPVSCLCAYDFFAGRAIRRLAGLSSTWPYRKVLTRTSRKIVSAVGRVDYCRVRFDGSRVEPLAISGASILSSTVRADGFVVTAAGSEGVPADGEVEVWLYD